MSGKLPSVTNARRIVQRGISLIELIIFIVIISVALTGILLVMNQTTAHSADPMIRKQALAIAESLLEEVELMPFTYCDPNDASAVTATSALDCTDDQNNGGGALGPIPNTETRGHATDPFDNVADYAGFGMAAGAILDITGAPIGPASGYSADIAIARAGTGLGLAADADALQITVTVNAPGGESVVLDGIRTRYSPNAVP